MAQHLWTILCAKSSVDRDTNNLTLIDVIERIQFHGVEPKTNALIPLAADLVTTWTRSNPETPEKEAGRARLFTPRDTQLGVGSFEIDLVAQLRARTIARLTHFPYNGPGVYYFVVDRRPGGAEEIVVGGRPPPSIQALPAAASWTEVVRLPLHVEFDR